MMILVFGLPGSGKSYFATHLAKVIKAEYISSDKTRKKTFNRHTYATEEKQLVYKEMIDRMKDALKRHTSVVLDATFYKRDSRNKFSDAANNIDKVIFIEVVAEESLIRERLRK